jgi:hypothetical protein
MSRSVHIVTIEFTQGVLDTDRRIMVIRWRETDELRYLISRLVPLPRCCIVRRKSVQPPPRTSTRSTHMPVSVVVVVVCIASADRNESQVWAYLHGIQDVLQLPNNGRAVV